MWLCECAYVIKFKVTSPLNSSAASEAGVTTAHVGVAAGAAEMRKHEGNDTKCAEHGWVCIPFAAVVPRHEGIMTNTPKSKALGERFCRLSFILMQSNARSNLARVGLVYKFNDRAFSGF